MQLGDIPEKLETRRAGALREQSFISRGVALGCFSWCLKEAVIYYQGVALGCSFLVLISLKHFLYKKKNQVQEEFFSHGCFPCTITLSLAPPTSDNESLLPKDCVYKLSTNLKPLCHLKVSLIHTIFTVQNFFCKP